MSNQFLVFQERAHNNISKIALKASKNNIHFRPHFKTHSHVEIGRLFRQHGVDSICVSSLEMAQYFAFDGWKDITIAFPLDINDLNEIYELAQKIKLQILIHDSAQLEAIQNCPATVGIMIEVDAGYHRSGIPFTDWQNIAYLIKQIYLKENLYFHGILSHYGNSYGVRTAESIKSVYDKSTQRMLFLADKLEHELHMDIYISVGDTPTTSVVTDFKDIDELRPGNFIFYDLMQLQIGSCSLQDIAAVVRCPIVGKKPQENKLIIHGGAVHLSKEVLDFNKNKCYGYLVDTERQEWKLMDSYVENLSQEHGIVQASPEDFRRYEIGDYVDIIPVHSCLSANLMHDFIKIV